MLVNFPSWHHYLEYQCDIIDVKKFHEMFRYLFRKFWQRHLRLNYIFYIFQSVWKKVQLLLNPIKYNITKKLIFQENEYADFDENDIISTFTVI